MICHKVGVSMKEKTKYSSPPIKYIPPNHYANFSTALNSQKKYYYIKSHGEGLTHIDIPNRLN